MSSRLVFEQEHDFTLEDFHVESLCGQDSSPLQFGKPKIIKHSAARKTLIQKLEFRGGERLVEQVRVFYRGVPRPTRSGKYDSKQSPANQLNIRGRRECNTVAGYCCTHAR